MDGTFAALWLLVGTLDAAVNHCGHGGCLAQSELDAYNSLSVGVVEFQGDVVSEELYFRRDTSLGFGPFRTIYGASATTDGELWAGIGLSTYHALDVGNGELFASLHFMPGLYAENGGIDLGGPVEFRSGIEVGYEAGNGIRYAFSFDHRSNGEIYDDNPGLETYQFRVSIPIR